MALITGGAGGIGAAIGRALAAVGFVVVVGFHRSAVAAEQLAASLPGSGHAALPAPVTDSAGSRVLAAVDGGRSLN